MSSLEISIHTPLGEGLLFQKHIKSEVVVGHQKHSHCFQRPTPSLPLLEIYSNIFSPKWQDGRSCPSPEILAASLTKSPAFATIAKETKAGPAGGVPRPQVRNPTGPPASPGHRHGKIHPIRPCLGIPPATAPLPFHPQGASKESLPIPQ